MIGTLSDEQVGRILKQNHLGRIACNDSKKSYIIPVNYVYDGHFIFVHSVEGMKTAMMRKNPAVCFEVEEVISFTSWKCVVAWGEYQELHHERDRMYAIKLFNENHIHIKFSKTSIPDAITEKRLYAGSEEINRPLIYRIVLNEKTGRFENE